MVVTDHAQEQAKARLGVDARRLAELMRRRELDLHDGVYETDMGTLVVRMGVLITVLAPEMAAIR